MRVVILYLPPDSASHVSGLKSCQIAQIPTENIFIVIFYDFRRVMDFIMDYDQRKLPNWRLGSKIEANVLSILFAHIGTVQHCAILVKMICFVMFLIIYGLFNEE